MRPERVVAAALLVLAASLIALLLFGPVEGTEAAAEPVGSVPTESGTVVTEEEEPEPVTTESEAVTTESEPVTTQPETEPSETVPPPQVSDHAVRIVLSDPSQVDSVPRPLHRKASSATIEATAIAVRGGPGDQHGLECSVPHWAYVFRVDPWNDIYAIERAHRPEGAIIELDRGEAPGLRSPPRANRLRATCTAGSKGAGQLVFVANGRRIAALPLDSRSLPGKPFDAVGLTAWAPSGDEEVIFDRIVVRAG